VTAGAARLSSLGRPSSSLDEALTRARRLVSERVGIIPTVWLADLAVDEPAVYWAFAEPANLVAATGRPARHRGGGASVDADRAIMKAVGESVERYCAALYDEGALPVASRRELDGDAVEPDDFVLFSPEQYAEPGFPYAPFTRDTSLRWAEGRSVATGPPTYVPATFVQLAHSDEDPREPPVWGPISTGLACGPDLVSATYRGVLEVVERDAFMVVWHNRLPRPAIDLASVNDPLVRRLLGAIEGAPIRCRAMLLTVDILVSVVMVLLQTDPASPPFTVAGLGADLDPCWALALALEEACMCYCGLSRSVAELSPRGSSVGSLDPSTDEGQGFAHAVAPDLRSTLDFLIEAEETIPVEDLPTASSGSPAANVEALVNRLSTRGFEAVSVDLTTPDVDEVGFKVVRAVVPGLQPLDHDAAYPHLGGSRLIAVPRELGLLEGAPGDRRVNLDPHPLA
jgi:ribosomal protein S12 methylthiotransferase accessory factor